MSNTGVKPVRVMINKTEQQKNDIVSEHKGIIYYMANRYRYLDDDLGELQALCFLGLSEAMNKYTDGDDFASMAFTEIKKAIYGNYYKTDGPKNAMSLDEPLYTSPDGSESTLGDVLPGDDFYYNENDIMNILNESLTEEQAEDRHVTIDYLMEETSVTGLSKKYELPLLRARRLIRRGKDLIKRHLYDNDIISGYLLYPPKEIRVMKKHEYKKLTKSDCEKIKYIRQVHQYLGLQDISSILKAEPFVITSLMNSPTTMYLRCVPDDSIKKKVEAYGMKHYPERIASKVTTYYRLVKIDEIELQTS